MEHDHSNILAKVGGFVFRLALEHNKMFFFTPKKIIKEEMCFLT